MEHSSDSTARPFGFVIPLTVAMAVSAFAGGHLLFANSANAAPGAKVEVCHIPPGNPDNFHTITISEKALAAHLSHGDLLGPCSQVCAALCDDGDHCTVDDTGDCEVQGCPAFPRDEVHCGEATQCTQSACDPSVGCVFDILEGLPCDDEAVCTENDECNADGACAGTEREDCCIDDSACNPTYCNGNFCGIDNMCASTGFPCEDNVECTVDICAEDPSGCENVPTDALCDDGVECTINTCDPVTGCQSLVEDALCDDGVDCTVDACDATLGCESIASDAACDDGVACTVNSCDSANGCEAIANDGACDDGNRCTIDKCDPSGPALDGCRNDRIPHCCNTDAECPAGQACNPTSALCEDAGGSADCNNRPPGLLLDGSDWSGIVVTGPDRDALRHACANEILSQGCAASESQLLSVCNATLLAPGSACLYCVSPGGNNSSGPCSSCASTLEIRIYQSFRCSVDVEACQN